MNNGEIYQIARANLVKKREKIGYVRLVTDCWGMVIEFEREWHRQNGGQSRIENLFPMYDHELHMRDMMKAAHLDTEQMVHILNWKHIHNDEGEFQTGDVAIILPRSEGQYWYSVFFYTGECWETSGGNSERMFDEISEYGALKSIGETKYLLRKKDWSEKGHILSDIDPNP